MVWNYDLSIKDSTHNRKKSLRARFRKMGRSRSGVSPVISTTIILAITVTLGLSFWSLVSSQANTSAESFTNEVTDYVNYVNERYVIVNMAFGYDDPKVNACTTDSKCITLWVYNYSEKDVKMDHVLFGTSSSQVAVSDFKVALSDGSVIENKVLKANELNSITLQAPDVVMHHSFAKDGTMYYSTVFTAEGTTQVYYQADK